MLITPYNPVRNKYNPGPSPFHMSLVFVMKYENPLHIDHMSPVLCYKFLTATTPTQKLD